MKKIFLSKAAVAASALGLTVFNVAAANNCKFYAGAGMDYGKYSLNKEITNSTRNAYLNDPKSKGFGLLVPVIGMNFHDNFGVEAGYSFNKTIKATATTPTITAAAAGLAAAINATSTETKIKTSNMYLDLVGFMPVSAGQFDLIGGIGLGKITAKKDKDISAMSIKNKFGWRVKAGAQYNVHSNIALRALVTYQVANNKMKYRHSNTLTTESKFIKNMTSVGLSAVYTF